MIKQLSPADPCFLQFTSGSTSTPKGVVVTQGMVVANCETMAQGIGYHEDERYCAWLPIYHDMGLLGYLRTCFHQSRTCFFPHLTFWPQSKYVDGINERRALECNRRTKHCF